MPSLRQVPERGSMGGQDLEKEVARLRDEIEKRKQEISKEERAKEQSQDAKREEREKAKLLKEIANPKPKRDPMLERPLSQREQERQMIEEYMKKQKAQEPNEDEYVETEPSGGFKCMTQGHQDKPATMKLKHHGVLGDMPTLSFCEECAALLKFIPVQV